MLERNGISLQLSHTKALLSNLLGEKFSTGSYQNMEQQESGSLQWQGAEATHVISWLTVEGGEKKVVFGWQMLEDILSFDPTHGISKEHISLVEALEQQISQIQIYSSLRMLPSDLLSDSRRERIHKRVATAKLAVLEAIEIISRINVITDKTEEEIILPAENHYKEPTLTTNNRWYELSSAKNKLTFVARELQQQLKEVYKVAMEINGAVMSKDLFDAPNLTEDQAKSIAELCISLEGFVSAQDTNDEDVA